MVMGVTSRIEMWWRERGAQRPDEDTGIETQWLAYSYTSFEPRQCFLQSLSSYSPLYYPEGWSVLLRTRARIFSELQVQGRKISIPFFLAESEASSDFTKISCLVPSKTAVQMGPQKSSPPILTPPTFFLERESFKEKEKFMEIPDSGWEGVVPSQCSCN